MKKIFTKLFLLATLLMASSELWAEDYWLVLNDPAPRTIGWGEEQTFSFNLVGPAEWIRFELDSQGKMDFNVYGYRESNPAARVSIIEVSGAEEGVFKYDIKGQGFSRIEIKVKARVGTAKLLNVIAYSPYYAYEYGLGSAEYKSAEASTSFTIDYYGTPNFSHSYLDGDWDNDKFSVKISASGGKATVTVTYPHDEVGKHDAMIIISNGVFMTTPYRFTGTTTKANQTIAWIPPTELTVGSTHTLSATAPGGAVSYVISGDAATLAGNTNTLTAVKEGTVTITASQAGNSNYNAAASVTETITIKKATPTVTAWPTITPVTYGTNLGAALVLKGGSASVAGTFAITDAYTAATVPNAGAHTYNLEFRPTESNKYNNVAGGTATLTVNKADQAIAWTATPPTELTVGDSHTLSATALGGAVAFAITGDAATLADNTLTAVQAGIVTITASQAGNGNYNAAANVTHSITINKATPTVTAWPTIAPVTYGTNLGAALVLKGGSASVAGTFVITDTYTAATVPNAGTHTYNVTFTPSETNKYNNVSGGTATLTVNKADQAIAWTATPPTAMTVGDSHTLSATATSGDAVAFAISGDAATLAGNTLTAVQAGTVTITASQAGNNNYNAAANVTHSITINKATPTVTAWPTLDAVTYGASLEQALVLVGGTASVEGTFAITDTYTAATVPNAGAHTYNLEFRPSETNKYNVVSGGTATLVVNKADQVLTWSFADCTLLPGQTLALDATSTCGDVSYKLTGSAISVSGNTLTAEAAGTATIKAVDTGNSNYNAVESSVYTVTVSESGYTRAVTNGNYGTICLPYGSSNYSGADFYEIAYAEIKDGDATGLYLDQIEEGAALVAGKPYIFKATADELIVTYEGAIVDAPEAGDAGLTGTLVDIAAGGVLVGNYIIAQNMFWDASAENYLNANRAYINKATLLSVPPKSLVPGRRRVSMGETSENAATDVENTQLPMINCQKLIENGQLIIIRDGVKYNAMGQKL